MLPTLPAKMPVTFPVITLVITRGQVARGGYLGRQRVPTAPACLGALALQPCSESSGNSWGACGGCEDLAPKMLQRDLGSWCWLLPELDKGPGRGPWP